MFNKNLVFCMLSTLIVKYVCPDMILDSKNLTEDYESETSKKPISTKFLLAVVSFWGYHVCTGSLLSSMWVLTAAHCKDEITIHYVCDATTRDGYIKQNGMLGWWCPVTKVRKIYLHPRFNKHTMVHDVALLKLVTPINENDNIAYVKLPSYHPQEITDFCPEAKAISLVVQEGKTMKVLKTPRHINLKILPIEDCKRQIPYKVSYWSICAETAAFNESCSGDSGSPLICNDTQYGIASWGIDCSNEWPSIYVRTDEYLFFINSTINSGFHICGCKFLVILSLYIYFVLYKIAVR